jgi:hypothetical protein
MRSLFFVSSAIMLSALAGYGCSSRDTESDVSEGAVTSAELAQARKVVALLSGPNGTCNRCHTAAKEDIRRWGTQMKTIEDTCLSPTLTLTPAQRVACLSDDPADPLSTFSAGKVGLYAAGARLDGLKSLFGTDAAGQGQYQMFVRSVAMPMGDAVAPLSDADFQTVRTWALAGMPALDEALLDPDLGPCRTKITPALKTYLSQAKSDGWDARHKDAATSMFGCAAGEVGGKCLTQFPDVTATWGAANVPQTLRALRDFNQRSNWQTRSSPDGRLVGFGYNNTAKIYDLSKTAADPGIKVNAQYDPVFFPSNDGFAFSGNAGIRVCKKSVLDAATTSISLSEVGCNHIRDDVYQTFGAALDGSVYWMSNGTHVNDDGANQATAPTALPGFDGNAKTVLTPMVSDGTKFVPGPVVNLGLPFEGDQQLSASSRLLVTRFGNKHGKSGYRFRKLSWTPTGEPASFTVATEDLGQICVRGTKPSSSFDERFVLTHQYADPAATPEIAANSSNLYLMDLLTGDVVRITNMPSQTYAFSAHFRADGWIYFAAKDHRGGASKETWVASDAALRRLEAVPTP